jgi:hypothetical protein
MTATSVLASVMAIVVRRLRVTVAMTSSSGMASATTQCSPCSPPSA